MATTDHPTYETALSYVERGYRVIPLHTSKNGCCSCHLGFKCPPKSQGKHPIDKAWQKTPVLSDADLRGYWDDDRPKNIGIVTGPESKLLVLDVDGDEGQSSLAALIAEHGALPRTLTGKTGSGGWHFVFEYPDFEVGNSAGKLGTGLDTRGRGGFIVVEPSVSGLGPYHWVESRGTDVAPAPDWLLDLLRPKVRQVDTAQEAQLLNLDPAESARLAGYTTGAVENEIGRLRALGPAGWTLPWNNTLFEVSANLIQLGLANWNTYSVEQAYADVFAAMPRDDGMTDDIVNRTFDSAKNKTAGEPAAYPPKPQDFLEFFSGSDLNTPPENISAPVDSEGIHSTTDSDDEFKSVVEEVPEVEYMTFNGVPAAGAVLDADLEHRLLAEQLGTKYKSTAHHVSRPIAVNDDVIDLANFVDKPVDLPAGDPALQQWLEENLLSTDVPTFLRAVSLVATGVDTDGPTIVFKGGGELLAALASTLHPHVGDDEETLLFGPRVSTKEVSVPQIIFAFADEPCPPFEPLALLALATPYSGPLNPPTPEEEIAVSLPDYRATLLERARLGMAAERRQAVSHDGTEDAS